MPSFHAKMQAKLRTEAMGADTAVWLAVSAAARTQPSGLFFQGRSLYTLMKLECHCFSAFTTFHLDKRGRSQSIIHATITQLRYFNPLVTNSSGSAVHLFYVFLSVLGVNLVFSNSDGQMDKRQILFSKGLLILTISSMIMLLRICRTWDLKLFGSFFFL